MIKTNKFKRVIITAMAAVCALSSATAISASAASEKYVHTVGVSTSYKSDDAIWISMKKKASCSDNFSSYPTIFNGYSNSRNRARAEYNNGKTKTAYKSFTLQKNNPAPKTVNYGTLKKGNWRLYYQHLSGGGFRSTVTTIKWY